MMTCLNVGQRNRYRQGAIIYRLLNAPFLRARMVVDGGGEMHFAPGRGVERHRRFPVGDFGCVNVGDAQGFFHDIV